MKRTRKVLLGLGGSTLVISCLLSWDTLRRAENSITDHERRLKEEIARVRSHPTCEEFLRNTPHVPKAKASLEQELEERWNRIWMHWNAHPAPARFEEEMLAELAQTQDSARECGVEGWRVSLQAENTLLLAWASSLGGAESDVTALRRRSAAFERIYAARPSLAEFVESERLIEKIELLRVLRRKADPSIFIHQPPCWRELYSWRVLIAKSLNQVDSIARMARELQVSPDAARPGEFEKLLLTDVHFQVDPIMAWRDSGPYEAAELTLWSVARAATAVALFRLERGRDPANLAELVPLYLREIPVTWPSGDRIEFQEGAVGASASKDVGAMPWHLFGR